MEANLLKKSISVFMVLIVAWSQAQTLNAPEPADNPNIPGNSAWQFACASAGFNEYFVNFTWGPPMVNPSNEFILELSDSQGNFDTATELARVNDKNTTFEFNFSFSLPQTTQGDGYRMRVRSTSPAVTGAASSPYSMYYLGYNGFLSITPNASGDIPPGGTITVCDGGSVTLGVDNLPDPSIYNYNWYRSGTLLSEKSSTLTVSQAGNYFVQIDYGPNCSNSGGGSNNITINTGNSQGITITAGGETALCDGDTVTLQASITGQGYTYTWYQNGNAITTPQLEASSLIIDASESGFEGEYQVEISGSGICLEQSPAVTITSAGGFEATRSNDPTLVLLPNQSVTLNITTDANTPSFRWFLNGTEISGATNATYEATSQGTYTAEVTETGGPCTSSTITVEATTVVVPSSFIVNINHQDSYQSCISTSTVLEISDIKAVVGAEELLVTSNVINNFNYQWLRNGTVINGENNTSISIASAEENGTYTLNATLDSFDIDSNALEVVLNSNASIEITSNGTQLCDGELLSISTSYNLTTVTYEWLLNGISIDNASEILQISQAGTYQLSVSTDGCPLLSNEITITPFDTSGIDIQPGRDVLMVEGQEVTFTATGATAYEWFDQNNTSLGIGDNVTISEPGNYTLLATIDNCQVSIPLSAAIRDAFSVPNIVTANGDGANDQWILPNIYSNQSDVNVTIYNENGELVLDEMGYQNNWPASSTSLKKKNQLFFYKIRKDGKTLKQGTITVIR